MHARTYALCTLTTLARCRVRGGRAAVAGALCRSEDCSFVCSPDSPARMRVYEPLACDWDCAIVRPRRRPVPSTHARLPTTPSQPNPSPGPTQFAPPGARWPAACSLQVHRATAATAKQALAWSRVLCVLLTCMYCTHTVIMRSSLDTASKRARAICHRNLV